MKNVSKDQSSFLYHKSRPSAEFLDRLIVISEQLFCSTKFCYLLSMLLLILEHTSFIRFLQQPIPYTCSWQASITMPEGEITELPHALKKLESADQLEVSKILTTTSPGNYTLK
jgi:hypothetical protein